MTIVTKINIFVTRITILCFSPNLKSGAHGT
ncbi:hypothetical protein EcWSU1_02835 [Enterobacter ludwigii]|uniref:Uncharacterized protein n=1 Tax=Enterobacter ludwigii TaxID=299767 RepID=G8LH61_9ENTR|nr:hypothetical protein EcWSU1_02835 [Enterobacter ludwigii]